MCVMDDCISLSDDDAIVEVSSVSASGRTQKSKCTDAIETIIIDEDVGPTSTDSDNVIVLSGSQMSTNNTFIQGLNKIRKEDTVFACFIDLCLQLENSDGMTRIIERTVMKSYTECDKDYLKSKHFSKLVQNTIAQLEQDPDHKFSHIKNFLQSMRAHKFKKKVDFITLSTNLTGKVTPGLTSKSKHKKSQSINNNDSIILDSDEEIPTVDLDENPSKIICLDDESEKENQRTENGTNNTEDNFLVAQEDALESSQGGLTLVEPTELPIEYEQQSSRAQLSLEVRTKVKSLENQIAYLKKQIMVFDEMDVTVDNVTSPYLMSEQYKAEVVKLYKELCTLLGQQPVKKRKVRLKVLDGHPSGPVKRLETFINNNIGEDGSPLFPDFCDVVKCVMVANIEDNLGWSKQQVMREANSLFVQCGRALQKKRQKREYRDLLARIKQEDHDPADDDPELLRRLELNRRAGVKKEMDLLERFSQIQDLPQRPKSGTILEEIFTNNHEPSCSNQVLDDGQTSINNVKSPTVGFNNGQHIGYIIHKDSILKHILPNGPATVIRIPKAFSNGVLVFDPVGDQPYNPANVPANENATVIENTQPTAARILDNVNSELISTDQTLDLGSTRTVDEIFPANSNHEKSEGINLHYDGNDQLLNSLETSRNHKPICNGNYEDVTNSDNKTSDESETNVNMHADEIEANQCFGIIVNESVQSIICNEILTDEDSNLEAPKIALSDEQTKETDVNTHAEHPDSPCSDIIISDEDSNFEPPEITLALPIKDEIMETESNVPETENHETIVKAEVKPEPMDIVKMLEELGDDYTTSVIDIEDPFLVIDISSDSSEDEMGLDHEDL